MQIKLSSWDRVILPITKEINQGSRSGSNNAIWAMARIHLEGANRLDNCGFRPLSIATAKLFRRRRFLLHCAAYRK